MHETLYFSVPWTSLQLFGRSYLKLVRYQLQVRTCEASKVVRCQYPVVVREI
jgi:hypothetical protein